MDDYRNNGIISGKNTSKLLSMHQSPFKKDAKFEITSFGCGY